VPYPATTVVTGLARDESRRRLLAAVDAMAETDRRLVLWRGLEGLPYAEVASRLGIAVAAAESRWRRVCQRLRQVLPELRLEGGC
jgi:DNA-directed RNA polymerase specialized sigma24 family protein